MLGDIFEGAVRFGASYIGGKKRLARREEAQAAYDTSMQDYFSQDTSNLYANLENTMEDLTVNQEAARFQMQQQAQGQANIMGGLSAAAGGSGIAALAQSLANQQAQSARAASIDIGRQEQANQMAAAGQAARLQMAERSGAEQSRALQAQLTGERFMIDAGELQASEEAIQAARAARTEALGQIAGGVGNYIAPGLKSLSFGPAKAEFETQTTSGTAPKANAFAPGGGTGSSSGELTKTSGSGMFGSGQNLLGLTPEEYEAIYGKI